MYSWEIDNLMKLRDYIISNEEYFKLFETSPQINYIEYQNCNDIFRMTTDDRYEFKFKVYKKTKDKP